MNAANKVRHYRARLFILLLVAASFPAHGQIESFTRLTAHPAQYQRADFTIMLTANWTNSPFRAEEVRLDLDLISPSGNSLVIPAFYNNGKSGETSSWSIRFTPVETGKYAGTFVLTNGSHCDVSKKLSFSVVRSGQKGFLHADNNWSFRFDDGEPFRGIGENVAWESRSRDDSRFFQSLNENPQYNYDYLLGKLSAAGGNFFRTWMCPWNLPLEWKMVGNTQRYTNDDNYFNDSAIQRMDQLVDLTASLNLYMMLTLDNSGDFQGRTWRRNNYNITNGGPVTLPQEFFTDPAARAQYKDRLRYLVARWGYSPNIAAWEFFNEIDNLMYGLPQKIPDNVITAWHTEMADYLKSIDPYHHLITTSISHRNVAGLYDIPSIDFNQIHIYGHNGQSRDDVFPETFRKNSQEYGKPYVIGEYGFEWDWNVNFDACATNMDWDFKRGLWLGLFSPAPVLPISWWWEYFDHRGTTKYIGHVRSVLDQMLAAGNGTFSEIKCQWTGPPVNTLSVKCGSTLFTLLENTNSFQITGNLSLPPGAINLWHIEAYDPEKDTTHALPAGLAATNITVPPMDCLILIANPRN